MDNLTPSEAQMLERHGLVERVGRKYKVTDFGKKFAEVLIR
ncbi:hypothetical protein [Archaeoglobus sp.]